MNHAPILSIGMIVKNESRCLEKCLKALEPLRRAIPCELVIADTGSDDGTWEIASQYADILFHFTWVKDFSAARNAVMDRCSGAWFLSIDADEYLDPDIQELVSFLKSPQRDTYTSAYYIINNYNNPSDQSLYTRFDAQRMLNLATGLRFFGRIHEGWPDESRKNNLFLGKTIFWHDGYVDFTNVAERKKGNRNLELIELELEEDPDNLLRVYQAQESCVDQKKQEFYIRRMIQMIEEGNPGARALGPICYRSAAHVAMLYHMPELEQWISDAWEKYPESPYIQIDVKYIQFMLASREKNYNKLATYVLEYLEAMDKLEQDGFGPACLLTGPLMTGSKQYFESAYIMLCSAYAHLKDWSHCGEILKNHLPMELTVENIKNWCNLAYLVWENVDLRDAFHQIGVALYQTSLKDELMQKRRDVITKRSLKLFSYIPIPLEEQDEEEFYPSASAYPLLVELGDDVLCPAARVMLSSNDKEVSEAAAQIKDWSELPPQPLEQILAYKLSIPSDFYQAGYSVVERMAGAVAAHLQGNTTVIALKWLQTVPENLEFPLDRVWRYDLLLAALRSNNWQDPEQSVMNQSLLDVFHYMSREYLNWIYHPNVLQEENIGVLPTMHQFAWQFIQYRNAAMQSNWNMAVFCLNQMLSCSPTMKKMVSYLLEDVQEKRKVETASPELLELAKKIRAILSQYPSDDPSVAVLKQSEAYQKVAYLIEGMESPAFGGILQ